MLNVAVAKFDLDQTETLSGNTRCYCVGDIHGCSDMLEALSACIDHHMKLFPVANAFEIHLGDMIDRGPDSRGVLTELAGDPGNRQRILIRGNHEQRVLDLLEDPFGIEQWLYEGGYETLLSYDVPRELLRAPLDPQAVVSRLRLAMGPHVALLQSTRLFHETGAFLFVHAGVDPYRTLIEQSSNDLLLIREPFISFDRPWEKTVIHGHTPNYSVTRGPHRIGLDTGAYATGRLSCLVIEQDKAMTLTISRP
jgi:serine/threonine protein phosphatase 1